MAPGGTELPAVLLAATPLLLPGGAFVAGVVWGAAVVGIANGLWGGCNWGGGDVNINVNKHNNINNSKNRINSNDNKFKHNGNARRDVPYRDSKSRDHTAARAPKVRGIARPTAARTVAMRNAPRPPTR
jgi:hypothetical protein